MKRLELSDDIFIKVYDLRSYNNEVIRESINAMFKITKELREKSGAKNFDLNQTPTTGGEPL